MDSQVRRLLSTLHRPEGSSPAPSNRATVQRQWLLECSLARVRAWAVALCLLAIPFFLPIALWLAALALGLWLGNRQTLALLAHAPRGAQLQRARWLAIRLEWLTVLGLLAACLLSGQPITAAPALLLVLLVLAGSRDGLAGLTRAAVGATLVLMLAGGLQLWLGGARRSPTSHELAAGWVLLVALMTLVLRAWLMAEQQWREERRIARQVEQATLRQLDYGLSERERVVLPLLADRTLTYAAIGQRLHISPETVKSHVQRIGQKLGVQGGRAAVVAVAEERGLLVAGAAPSPSVEPESPASSPR